MSLIQASITASASVEDFSNNLATTLYLREADRAGVALNAHASNNYLNFVCDVADFVANISINAVTADGSGISDASDVYGAFSWSDGNNFAASCTLYDVRLTGFTHNHNATDGKGINISDFLTLDTTNTEETHITFGGSNVNGGTSDGALDASAGSVDLDCTIASASSTTSVDPSCVLVYGVANDVELTVVKEDNLLAQDGINFGSAPVVDGTGADDLYASTTLGEKSGNKVVSGSVSAVDISGRALTKAIQYLLDMTDSDMADLTEVAEVRNALAAKATDSSGATFKGLIAADTTNLTITTQLGTGGSSVSSTKILQPQIFFHQYVTGADGNLYASSGSVTV